MMKRATSLILLAALTGCGQAPALSVSPSAAVRAAAPTAAQSAAMAPAADTRTFDSTSAAGAATTAATPAAAVSFEMLTYNTWGKPWILGKDQKSRFGLLAPAIKGYDLVTLQETFTGYAKDMAKASGFPYAKRSENGDLFHLNAGLYTLTRFKILETDFAKFKEAGDFDQFANKGVQFTRLEVPGIGEVDVYTTHYQSKRAEKYAKIRLHDNTVLEAMVKKHAKGNPTICSGDFNMTPDSPEYADLKARLHFRDAFAEAHPGAPGYTSGPPNPYKDPESAPKRVDYVFVLPCDRVNVGIASCDVTMDQPVGGKFLSDHFGVRARLTFQPRS